VLPSDPLIVTCVAFAAFTVNVDDCPELIDVGLAVIVTVGAGGADVVTVTVVCAVLLPPLPVAVAV
jgi:hypothetical protein